MALIDKASLLMVPSTYEAGKLYNVLPSGNRAPDSTDQNSGYDQTRADFDFDRGSNAAATRVNAAGLIEKYRENLLTESNNFSDSDWVNSGITLTSGQSGPFGSNNGWRYLMSGGIGGSFLYQNNRTINGSPMVLSFWVKSNTSSNQTFRSTANSGGQSSPDFTATTSWQRFSWFFVSNAGGSNILLAYNPTTNIDLVIYGAQFEQGLVATDYLNSTDVTAKAGVLVDLPRINYDANGKNGALILEPSATQLLPQSEYFGGSNWDKTANGTASIPVLTYGVESPEGLNNAYEITFNTGAGTSTGDSSVLAESISGQSAGAYTLSFYAKVSSGTNKIIARGAGGSSYTTCNLTSSWKRFEITETLASSGIIYIDIGLRRGLANEPLNSSVTCQIYGANLTKSSYPTSYIPTMGTAQTRAADSCSGGGSAESINSVEGVLYAEAKTFSITGSAGLISLSNGTTSNRVTIELDGANIKVRFVVGGSSIGIFNYAINIKETLKIAAKYKANDFALWVNGTERVAITSGSSFSNNTLSELAFDRGDGNEIFLGNVKQVAVFNEALTDSELATLTTL